MKSNESHDKDQSLDGKKTRSHWFFTNIGNARESIHPDDHIFPPSTYDIRVGEVDHSWDNHKYYVNAYEARRGKSYDIVYPMHPVCLELLEQNYSSLARGTTFNIDVLAKILASQDINVTGQGIKPDWSCGTYDGAEYLWLHGSDWMRRSAENIIPELEGYDYLVKDPASVQSFDNLLRSPPTREQIENAPSSQATAISPAYTYATDCFAELPKELLIEIVCLLPTLDMRSFRSASRTIATLPLTQTYWRTRFDYPHELSHVHRDPSWALSEVHNGSIDWKFLYNTVLHAGGDDSAWFKNWNRIRSLTRKLAYEILEGQGISVQVRDFKSNDPCQKSIIRQSFFLPIPSVLDPTTVMFNEKFPLEEVRQISLTFKLSLTTKVPCLSGIAFHGMSEVKKLGACQGNNIKSAVIGQGHCLAGFILRIKSSGIIGVQIVVSDTTGLQNTMEPCLGSLTDKWYKVGLGRLAALENSRIDGIQISISKQNCIVSIGLLEPTRGLNDSPSSTNITSSLGKLWKYSMPPQHFIITPSFGSQRGNEFRYSKHIIFGQNEEEVGALTAVCCSYNLSPPRLTGLEFLFEGQSSVSDYPLRREDLVEFCIDGQGGEILSGVDVFWSDETRFLGINNLAGSLAVSLTSYQFLTNKGRRSTFNQSMINGDFAVERLLAPPGTVITGVYADTNLRDQWESFGLICAPVERSLPFVGDGIGILE
ncbi:hypothetical protein NHQ30_008562 [Ciborinia camelliae]|nr:hypothetical protein NHQ30_008562 [Ciborinia camelliae]